MIASQMIFAWTQTDDGVRLKQPWLGQRERSTPRDMSHESVPRLAPRPAESHNTNDANSGCKEAIYEKRFIALEVAVNLRPRSVGRGRILSGARCEVGRSPCMSCLHAPCHGGPGGAWWSRLWVRTVGTLRNPYAQHVCIYLYLACRNVKGAGMWPSHSISDDCKVMQKLVYSAPKSPTETSDSSNQCTMLILLFFFRC